MHEGRPDSAIETWLSSVRAHFLSVAPEFLPLFETYAGEARFGRQYIDGDLNRMRPDAKILEVGAGSFLLSCQLVREGFDVTSLEPVGIGFPHFDRMQQVVLAVAHSQGCCPAILDQTAESLDATAKFEYAFSVNVMEHVNDVESVLRKVGSSLVVGGSYRFTCPNYIFPYEPHFNIPTLFSKKLTERVLAKSIFGNTMMRDPAGTWKSLNWINVIGIKRIVSRYPDLKVSFYRSMLTSTLERLAIDADFAARRSAMVGNFTLVLVKSRLHVLFRLAPAAIQPIMDCRIERTSGLGVH